MLISYISAVLAGLNIVYLFDHDHPIWSRIVHVLSAITLFVIAFKGV